MYIDRYIYLLIYFSLWITERQATCQQKTSRPWPAQKADTHAQALAQMSRPRAAFACLRCRREIDVAALRVCLLMRILMDVFIHYSFIHSFILLIHTMALWTIVVSMGIYLYIYV